MDKLFTPREVDDLLPKLESIFVHMDVLQKRTHGACRHAASTPRRILRLGEVAESEARIRSQMEFLLNAVHEDIRLIEQLGGAVKDIDTGLVDFLGRVEGEEVWLCWKKRAKTKSTFAATRFDVRVFPETNAQPSWRRHRTSAPPIRRDFPSPLAGRWCPKGRG